MEIDVKTFVTAIAILAARQPSHLRKVFPITGPMHPPGDSYGKPYSGARPLHTNAYRRAYAYQRRAHIRPHHHWPHWYD
jgi:hypothetical protein